MRWLVRPQCWGVMAGDGLKIELVARPQCWGVGRSKEPELDCCRTLLDQWRMVSFFIPKREQAGAYRNGTTFFVVGVP